MTNVNITLPADPTSPAGPVSMSPGSKGGRQKTIHIDLDMLVMYNCTYIRVSKICTIGLVCKRRLKHGDNSKGYYFDGENVQ